MKWAEEEEEEEAGCESWVLILKIGGVGIEHNAFIKGEGMLKTEKNLKIFSTLLTFLLVGYRKYFIPGNTCSKCAYEEKKMLASYIL